VSQKIVSQIFEEARAGVIWLGHRFVGLAHRGFVVFCCQDATMSADETLVNSFGKIILRDSLGVFLRGRTDGWSNIMQKSLHPRAQACRTLEASA
jgi:hypothetical protein